ncbi:MAG: hypothetical protein J5966_03380 [Lachnospiraceae bacterium]|nr:hypothetical protein [Lachnospiraceae bacterium]
MRTDFVQTDEEITCEYRKHKDKDKALKALSKENHVTLTEMRDKILSLGLGKAYVHVPGRWALTDSEIKDLYIHAKNKRAQVSILADLNAVTRSAMVKKLNALGLSVDSYLSTQTNTLVKRDRSMLRDWKRGLSRAAIGEKYGLSIAGVDSALERACQDTKKDFESLKVAIEVNDHAPKGTWLPSNPAG